MANACVIFYLLYGGRLPVSHVPPVARVCPPGACEVSISQNPQKVHIFFVNFFWRMFFVKIENACCTFWKDLI
jgi:hypothetical protein